MIYVSSAKSSKKQWTNSFNVIVMGTHLMYIGNLFMETIWNNKFLLLHL